MLLMDLANDFHETLDDSFDDELRNEYCLMINDDDLSSLMLRSTLLHFYPYPH